MGSSIDSEQVKDKIDEGDKKTLEEKIEETTKWLDVNQSAEKEEYEEKQKELEGIALPILQKMGGGAPGAGGMPDMGGMGGMPDMSGMGGMPGAGGAPPAADPAVVQPLKKSIKLFVTNFDFNRLCLNCECHLMVARNFLNYFKFNNCLFS